MVRFLQKSILIHSNRCVISREDAKARRIDWREALCCFRPASKTTERCGIDLAACGTSHQKRTSASEIYLTRNSQTVKQFPDYYYDGKEIIADGDHVVFHSHATIKKSHRGNDKKGFNIIDNWKIKDGEIVKHWDSLQALDGFMRFYTLLNGGKIRNSNGVF